jgi:predicted GNAT family N-acyltransferase
MVMDAEKLQCISFNNENAALMETAAGIRRTVFVEEQWVDIALEYDEFEKEAIHYLLFSDQNAVGVARRRLTAKGIKIERIAVLPAFRNKGLGAVLLNYIMEDIGETKQLVYLHAQLPSVSLYERGGFEKKGGVFYEADMAHLLMEKKPS